MNLFNRKTLDRHATKGVMPPEHFAALDAWAEMVRSGQVFRQKETALHEELVA